MSEILQINTELTRLGQALEIAANEYPKLAREANDRRNEYDVAYMTRLIKQANNKDRKPSAEERKAEAKLACESLMCEARTAEVMRDGMKERIKALQAALTAVQTRAAMAKQEMMLAGQFN